MGPEMEGYSERQNKWPGHRPLALLCAATLLLQACASPYIEEKTKASFGRIGLVSASFTPEIEIPKPIGTPESGALFGAGVGTLGGLVVGTLVLTAALSSCIFAPPACPAVAPYILGGATAGGAVGAAIGSADERTANAAGKFLGPVIEKQLVQDALRARVMAYAMQNGVGPLAVIDDPRPSTPLGSPDYRHLSGKGIDTVLEVRLLELNLKKMGILSDKYEPRTVARARVIRVKDKDQVVLSDQTYGLRGEEAVLDTWGGDNGRRFQAWVKYAYATLAEYILIEMILGYEGLVGATGRGLRPENPELRVRALYCIDCISSPSRHLFTEVDTLRPDFRWEPLVGAEQSADDKAPEKIQDVKYEIRLFTAQRTDRGFFGVMVPELLGGPIYSRSGLVKPRHRIEKSLAPCTKYFWTVRARFRIDGQPRLTEWANLHGQPWQRRRSTWDWYGRVVFRPPTDYYLPFQTHCPANAGTNQGP